MRHVGYGLPHECYARHQPEREQPNQVTHSMKTYSEDTQSNM